MSNFGPIAGVPFMAALIVAVAILLHFGLAGAFQGSVQF